MEDLQKLNNLFAVINLKMFCEKYSMSYDNARKILKGERPLTANFKASTLQNLRHYAQELQESI